jgi:hypothetical protein
VAEHSQVLKSQASWLIAQKRLKVVLGVSNEISFRYNHFEIKKKVMMTPLEDVFVVDEKVGFGFCESAKYRGEKCRFYFQRTLAAPIWPHSRSRTDCQLLGAAKF